MRGRFGWAAAASSSAAIFVEHAQIAGGVSGQGSDQLRGYQMRATGLIQGEDQILLE
jgi:hypothetical protein